MNPSENFSGRLIAWQQRSGRHDLPWQASRDPYRIWLSEIMLQQTQVSTVIPYYERFLAAFPDLASLARAPVGEVLALWSGLGYYARARNLHRCAQELVSNHQGRFPDEPETLATLPGIGRSTAAAIAVFAYGQRAAILDGNVRRVFCRHAGIDGFPGAAPVQKQLWRMAESLLPATDIESYTQGLMDLGATLCTRRKPDCVRCPVASDCVAREQGRQHELPAASPRRGTPERHTTFLLLRCANRVLLKRRPPSGLWGGLLVPPEGQPGDLPGWPELAGATPVELGEIQHSFTHFRLRIRPLLYEVQRLHAQDASWEWLDLDAIGNAALPTPVARLLGQIRGENPPPR